MANGILSVDALIEQERLKRANQALLTNPNQSVNPITAGDIPALIQQGQNSVQPQPMMSPVIPDAPFDPPQKKPNFLQRIGQGLKDPTTLTALGAAFNQMTLNPNAQLQQRASDMLAVRALKNQSNQTIKMLMESGDPQAIEVAKLIEADPANAKSYVQSYMTARLRAPKETYTQMTGAQINEMTGVDAYEPNAVFNVASDSGKVSQVGGGGVAIDLGGDQPVGLEALDKAYAQDHLDWTSGGGPNMGSEIAQIHTVLQNLEKGDPLTGPAVGLMSNFGLLGIVNPDAEDAKQQVEQVVQSNLKLVLGAQFTEKEGEQLIARAYNPMLSPEKNIARLRKLYLQMKIAWEQRQAMADYFNKNYTLRGYEGPQPNLADFYTALSGLSVGQVVNGYEYLGGDRMVESNWKKVGP